MTERTETTHTTTTTKDQDMVEERIPGAVIVRDDDIIVTPSQTIERPVNERRTQIDTTTSKTERG